LSSKSAVDRRATQRPIDLDALADWSLDTIARRRDYRVAPERDEPVILLVEGHLLPVFDISAGGFSCRDGGLQVGMRYRLRLNLPDTDEILDACADLLCRDGEICRFRFVDLDATQHNSLHHYVLQRQKRLIRAQRDAPPDDVL